MSVYANAPAPPPINWSSVKQQLIGVRPWLEGAAAEGYTSDHIENKVIPAAVREFERYTNYRVNLCQIVTRPDYTYTGSVTLITNPATGASTTFTVPVIERDALDVNTQDMNEFFRVIMIEHPVQLVQRMRIMLNDQPVYEIPAVWYALQRRTSKLSLLPVYGPLLAANVLQLFQLNVSMQDKDYAPNVLCIDYVAGLLPGWQDDYEYADLRRALESYAAAKVLEDISELADAGLRSVGTAGESREYSRFDTRKKELMSRVDAFKNLWDEQENPVMMGWV